MVCSRCVQVVEQILQDQGLAYQSVQLGEATLDDSPAQATHAALRDSLEQEGFQLLDDERVKLIEKIKNPIIRLIHQPDRVSLPVKISVLLEENTGADYTYLSRLFSETEGTTIEKYLIAQRIERAKELLAYDELNLNQIADKLGYSSTSHLSSQFRQVTGMAPSRFKDIATERRTPLDQL